MVDRGSKIFMSPRGLIRACWPSPFGLLPQSKIACCNFVEPLGRYSNARRKAKIKGLLKESFYFGVPTGIRTPVTSVKGRCPRPLDDGDRSQASFLACGGGKGKCFSKAKTIARDAPGNRRAQARKPSAPQFRVFGARGEGQAKFF